MAQKKLSIPFLAILILGLVAAVVLGAIITRQIKNKDVSSIETATPTVTATPQPTTSPASSPTTITQPKVPKPVYPEGWTEYRNDKLGFLVAYPDESKKYWASCAQYSIATFSEYPNMISLGCTGGDGIGTISKFNLTLEEAKRSDLLPVRATKSISQTTVGAGKYPATMIVYKSTIPDVKIDDVVVFFVPHDQVTYVLLWHSYNSKTSRSYENVGNLIFKTFQIL